MATVADSLLASASRPVTLRRRADITAVRHVYQGRGCWVLKDPVGLRYTRLYDEEYFIFKALDGETNFAQIKEQFEERFTPLKVSFNDIQQLIAQLHRSGLLIGDVSGQGAHLFHRHKEHLWKQWVGMATNVFAIRWKGVDPQRLLNWLHRYLGWFFTAPAVFCCMLLALAALTLVVVQYETFQSRLPTFHSFFGPSNWIYLGVTLGMVKVLHEFGHGLACKRYGGECHEMGFMLLVFTPALFCNVTDSWMLRSKWSRMAIGAAGMYVEMLLASIATFLWWFSEPGLLNHISLSVMFVCSVSTLMFNGNPLLRFDGYYILADYMEIPNMRQKASEVLRRWVFVYCLGMDLPEDPFLPQRNRLFMAVFTIASAVYRWVVVFSILIFVKQALEPYGLQVAGRLLGAAGLFGLVVQPAYQMYKFFHVPGRLHQVKRPRLILTLSILTVAFLLFAFLPLPCQISCPLEVASRGAASVFVSRPGELAEVFVKPGDQVKKGDTLAQLKNLDLELQLSQLIRERDELQSQRQTLNKLRFTDRSVLPQLPQLDEQLSSIRRQIRDKQIDMRRLTLVASATGIVLPAPAKPADDGSGQLPTWSGSPLDASNLHAYLAPGDLFCQIGQSARTEVVLVIEQNDIEFVSEGQPLRVKIDAYPENIYLSTLDRIAATDMKTPPRLLSQQAGGSLATKATRDGAAQPLTTSYQARALINNHSRLLHPGLRGQAKISTRWRSLGARTWRYLARTFHFEA